MVLDETEKWHVIDRFELQNNGEDGRKLLGTVEYWWQVTSYRFVGSDYNSPLLNTVYILEDLLTYKHRI